MLCFCDRNIFFKHFLDKISFCSFKLIPKTAAVEILFANKLGLGPIDMSEQQIIDCSNFLTVNSKYKPNQGCNGGTPIPTLQYIIDNGLMAEADYPYAETVNILNLTKALTKIYSFKLKNKDFFW